ncbi:PPOX class F420-dependent oxidoreductase [Streptomyces sp. NPDC059740]|uniref:PPOX class F420-dependent oxidoreductase n=1 Tax=Streptomyces sp. NPDC059740 TaxID=3346926 RepID=UPI003650AA98
MARTMSSSEWQAFVSEGTRTAKVATVRADGRPHVAPVWFVLDGDTVVLMTGQETVKGRNLTRDPRMALCVDDERPPFAFVTLEGRAELSEDLDAMRLWATRIAARYVGAEEAETFGARNAVPGELLVRIRVERAVAVTDLTD